MQRYLAFSLNLSNRIMQAARAELFTVFQNLALLDVAYIYHPNWNELPNSKGEALVRLQQYFRPDHMNIYYSMRDGMCLLYNLDPYAPKQVFFLTDRFDEKDAASLKRVFAFEGSQNCHFFILGIGGKYNRVLLEETAAPHTFRHFESLKGIGEYINGTQQNETD